MKTQITSDIVRIASPAKLNLFFEVLARRADGFHEIETVMTRFPLFDALTFKSQPGGDLRLTVRNNRRIVDSIPHGPENLIIKTLALVRELANSSDGMSCTLFKNIPVQAGLGGASGNAAAALLAANRIWRLNWPLEKLKRIAQRIGSDVAFFLGSGLASCTGRGEQVHNLDYPCRLNIVVAKPAFGLSTHQIYARCSVPREPISTNTFLSGLQSRRPARIGGLLFNRLEQIAANANGGIVGLRKEFEKTNCIGHQMTGSGSCWFGIYTTRRAMHAAARQLASRLPDAIIYSGQT